jgi:hypothetical protein
MTTMERYEFTEKEIQRMKGELAQDVALVERLREEKRATIKTATEQIKTVERRCFELAAKINSGYEMRELSNQRALAFPER